MTPARILAVVGPSGVGKDSLIAALAATDRALRPIRRVITRPADETEPFLSATPQRFAEMVAEGAFALTWDAHGLRYGIPRAAIGGLHRGQTGLVNLSRGVLAQASDVLPGLLILSVTAPAPVLAARLSARGREDAAAIAARLARPAPALPAGRAILTLDNGGTLEASVERVLGWLAQTAPA